MENITGAYVVDKDFLKTRLKHVDKLRDLLNKNSVLIDAPRRFGKTSVIKEFERQNKNLKSSKSRFNTIFLELEGVESINQFCLKFSRELLALYKFRNNLDKIEGFLTKAWNATASRLKSLSISEFITLEISESFKDLGFAQWREKLEPLILSLDSMDNKTVIIMDEFPDMLINFQKSCADRNQIANLIDSFTAWLRSLRQTQSADSKFRFVFCGSINLRKTLEDLHIGKRINDLETLRIPPMDEEEAACLMQSLSGKYEITINDDAISFIISKIIAGPPYYGQILFKAINDVNKNKLTLNDIKSIYNVMIKNGDHDLAHFHSRLSDYLSPQQREVANVVLKHVAAAQWDEDQLFQSFISGIHSRETFNSVLDRLIFEGYIVRDVNADCQLRFVSRMLQDWWINKTGGEI